MKFDNEVFLEEQGNEREPRDGDCSVSGENKRVNPQNSTVIPLKQTKIPKKTFDVFNVESFLGIALFQ